MAGGGKFFNAWISNDFNPFSDLSLTRLQGFESFLLNVSSNLGSGNQNSPYVLNSPLAKDLDRRLSMIECDTLTEVMSRPDVADIQVGIAEIGQVLALAMERALSKEINPTSAIATEELKQAALRSDKFADEIQEAISNSTEKQSDSTAQARLDVARSTANTSARVFRDRNTEVTNFWTRRALTSLAIINGGGLVAIGSALLSSKLQIDFGVFVFRTFLFGALFAGLLPFLSALKSNLELRAFDESIASSRKSFVPYDSLIFALTSLHFSFAVLSAVLASVAIHQIAFFGHIHIINEDKSATEKADATMIERAAGETKEASNEDSTEEAALEAKPESITNPASSLAETKEESE